MTNREHGLVTAIDFLVQGGDQASRALTAVQEALATTKAALEAETKAHAVTTALLADANAKKVPDAAQ